MTMVDFATQRLNMVESQVRPSDVTDRRIMRAMLEIPREHFVPEAIQSLAYTDGAVPVSGLRGQGRCLLPARIFAKLIQLADVRQSDAVLDVGVATAYSAAVLARLARNVTALECDAGLADAARGALTKAEVQGVTVVLGALPDGAPEQAPYDVILVQGAIMDAPSALLSQLKDGGRLAAIFGAGPAAKAMVWRRYGNAFSSSQGFDAAADVLPGFARAPAFSF